MMRAPPRRWWFPHPVEVTKGWLGSFGSPEARYYAQKYGD